MSANKKIQRSVYLSPKTDKYIRDHMKAQSVTSFAAAIEDAIEYAFDPELRGEREAELTKKINQLTYSLSEHRQKTARDLIFLQELMLRLLYESYYRMPQVPEDIHEAKHAKAMDGLNRVIKEVKSELDMGVYSENKGKPE
ncbi:hypothetical protein N9Z27_03120 [Alphaproteobacteria bacterium]|nr:hypothetical protein [Alphaproteobacteria bacterium]